MCEIIHTKHYMVFFFFFKLVRLYTKPKVVLKKKKQSKGKKIDKGRKKRGREGDEKGLYFMHHHSIIL